MSVPRSLVRNLARITRVWGPRWNARPLRRLYCPGQPESAVEGVVDAGGVRLKLNTASAFEWNLYFYSWERYEPEVRHAIENALQPDQDALDIGANIGIHTITMARRVPFGRVVACEPNPVVANRLKNNVALNNLENVTVRQVAVTAESGPVPLTVPNDEFGLQAWASLRDGGEAYLAASHCIDVYGISVDSLIEEERLRNVGLIKVDVEGFEPEVLMGAKQTLQHHRPTLIFEYTRAWWAERGHSLETIAGWLTELGYRYLYTVGTHYERTLDIPEETGMVIARI
jgi:FkbM family methyltransferase